MKVLIATQTYYPGNGQASFAIHLAENLVRAGHQVVAVTAARQLHSYSEIINGVQVEKLAAVHMSILHPTIYVTPFPRLRINQIIRKHKPDVIHIQDHYFLCSAVVNEAYKLGVPLIGTNHFLPENLLPFFKNQPRLQRLFAAPLWQMMLAVFNKLEFATTPSETAAGILRQQKIRVPVHVVSNGVDTNRFCPDLEVDRAAIRFKYNLDPRKITFLYVGRLDGEKRIDILLDAVFQLKKDDIQLAIAGIGLDEQKLKKQAKDLGLSDGRVNFIGFVSPADLPALYNSADIFTMPSPEELQSIATLEAMACGKPVLAANARALPELVKPRVNGYLFQPGSATDASESMLQLLNKREKWPAMGQASWTQVQPHSLSNTVRHYEDYYQAVMERVYIPHHKVLHARSILRKTI